jgi:hypothetical protein
VPEAACDDAAGSPAAQLCLIKTAVAKQPAQPTPSAYLQYYPRHRACTLHDLLLLPMHTQVVQLMIQAQSLPAPSTVYGVLATFGGIPSFNITQPGGLVAAQPLSACTAIQNRAPGEQLCSAPCPAVPAVIIACEYCCHRSCHSSALTAETSVCWPYIHMRAVCASVACCCAACAVYVRNNDSKH